MSETRTPAEEPGALERIAALESTLASMSECLTSRRLVVGDPAGRCRLVAETVDGVVELRLELLTVKDSSANQVLLFASPGAGELPAGVGMQLWLHGEVELEQTAWRE